MESVGIELRRRYKAAGQRPDGTDDDIDTFVAKPPQRCRARLLNIGVRRQAGIWIGLPSREGAYSLCTVRIQFAMKIGEVGCERLNAAILRSDDNQRPPQELPEARNKQGARAARQTRHDDVGLATQCLRGNAPEIGDIGDPHKTLMNAFFQYFHIGPGLAPQWPWWNNLV